MKYKYQLIERRDESPEGTTSDTLREKNNLILAPKGNYTLDQILDILKNPKPEYLKGIYIPFSENEKEIKLNIYGEKNIKANVDKNKQLKINQKAKYGKLFYKHIEDEISKIKGKSVKFERIITEPVGGFILGLPLMTKNNNDIITDYIKLTKNSKKSSGLKWEELPNEAVVKILTDNMSMAEKTIDTILSNAGLKSGEDYSLRKEKVINELKNIIKEIITNERLSFKKRF
jgi:hypothetical protein